MNIDNLTPNAAILEELGNRLSRIRKQQGHSQEALATAAGIGVATLRRIEDGKDGQLSSWLKILKALRMESAIDALLPETFHSPMAEVLEQKKRPRRSRKRSGPGFVWGDDQS